MMLKENEEKEEKRKQKVTKEVVQQPIPKKVQQTKRSEPTDIFRIQEDDISRKEELVNKKFLEKEIYILVKNSQPNGFIIKSNINYRVKPDQIKEFFEQYSKCINFEENTNSEWCSGIIKEESIVKKLMNELNTIDTIKKLLAITDDFTSTKASYSRDSNFKEDNKNKQPHEKHNNEKYNITLDFTHKTYNFTKRFMVNIHLKTHNNADASFEDMLNYALNFDDTLLSKIEHIKNLSVEHLPINQNHLKKKEKEVYNSLTSKLDNCYFNYLPYLWHQKTFTLSQSENSTQQFTYAYCFKFINVKARKKLITRYRKHPSSFLTTHSESRRSGFFLAGTDSIEEQKQHSSRSRAATYPTYSPTPPSGRGYSSWLRKRRVRRSRQGPQPLQPTAPSGEGRRQRNASSQSEHQQRRRKGTHPQNPF